MLDEKAKKTMLRKIPHGLYICGVKDGEEMNGFTSSWVMQTSFQPPLIVNCVRTDSGSHEMVKNSGVFALSFLDSNQKDMAATFFQPKKKVGDKLEDVEFYEGPETGCPIIKDSLGYIECKVVDTSDKGDHTIYVAEVIGSGIHREGEQLRLETTGWQYGG